MYKPNGKPIHNAQLQGDPTHTKTLRDNFVKEADRRFRALKLVITQSIVDNDCFALRNSPITQASPSNTKGPKWGAIKGEYNPIPARRFNFTRSADKVEGFMDWLEGQQNKGILQVSEAPQMGEAIDKQWQNKYIQSSYKKGIQRGRQELQQAGYSVSSIEAQGGIDSAFNQPFHADRVGALYTRAFQELKGITSAMDQQISRTLADGMAQGLGPEQMARNINDRVDKIGRTRARTLARTETIRAHHEATIQEYENAGAEGVTVKAEWSTAGDTKVCPICAPLEGQEYDLKTIRGMIPRHPNCFIDPQTPIYTSEGWKPIGKIEIGDLVLTHRGKFRKVYALPRTPKVKSPEVVRFKFKGDLTVTMTADHPVLVSKPGSSMARWKKAKDCKSGDFSVVLSSGCKRCGKLIPYYRHYCTRTCLSLDITDKQWSDPNHRKNVSRKNSESMLNQYKLGLRDKDRITDAANEKTREMVANNAHPLQDKRVRERGSHLVNTPEQRRRSSERMKRNNPMYDPVVVQKTAVKTRERLRLYPETHPNRVMAVKGRRTDIEQKMKDLLDQMGFEYEEQLPISSPNGGWGQGAYYYVDFALTGLNIVIECDGSYWHQEQHKDAERQIDIEAQGWTMVRFTDDQINTNLQEVQDEIARISGNHAGTYDFCCLEIESVQKWNLQGSTTLYNLSVEEDESYLAKGIAVHNCRCVALPIDRS